MVTGMRVIRGGEKIFGNFQKIIERALSETGGPKELLLLPLAAYPPGAGRPRRAPRRHWRARWR